MCIGGGGVDNCGCKELNCFEVVVTDKDDMMASRAQFIRRYVIIILKYQFLCLVIN